MDGSRCAMARGKGRGNDENVRRHARVSELARAGHWGDHDGAAEREDEMWRDDDDGGAACDADGADTMFDVAGSIVAVAKSQNNSNC